MKPPLERIEKHRCIVAEQIARIAHQVTVHDRDRRGTMAFDGMVQRREMGKLSFIRGKRPRRLRPWCHPRR